MYIADFNVAKDCKNTKPVDEMLKEEDNENEEPKEIKLVPDMKRGNTLMTDSSLDNSAFFDDDEEDSFKMLTKTAGTLAFAAPERIADNCYYT